MTAPIPFDIAEAKATGFYASGAPGSGKTVLAKHLVKKLIDDGCVVLVFDTSKAWLENTPIPNAVKVNSPLEPTFNYPVQNTVFDISTLKITERFIFVNAICEAIMHSRATSTNLSDSPYLFTVFEESQLYLPNGCMRNLKKYGSVLNLISVGRNYKVRYGIVTQFPANVDKAPVKGCQQRYFGRTSERNDLTYVQSFFQNNYYTKCPKQSRNVELTDEELKQVCAKCPKNGKGCVRRLGKGQFLYQHNETQMIQTTDYRNESEKPQEIFTINGQQVNFDYQLQGNNMTLRYVT